MKINESKELMIFAFRYALGRKSTAPSTVTEIIKRNHHILDDNDKNQIIKDIKSAIKLKSAGMDMDIKIWKSLAVFLKESM